MPAPFISREDLADHLHLADGALDDDDAALQAVDAACDMIRDLTGQMFNRVADDEILMDGTGTDALLLPELPVEEVSSVVVTGEEDFTGYTYTLHDSGVLLRSYNTENVSGWDGCAAHHGLRWPKGRNNIAITYTHGYTDAEFPRSVRMLALKLAETFYRSRPAGLVSETLGQHSVNYASEGTFLSPGEQLIIRKHTYRRQPARVVAA